MGYNARVKKDRVCKQCGRTLPAADTQTLLNHALDCARRKRLEEIGIVTLDAPTGGLIQP